MSYTGAQQQPSTIIDGEGGHTRLHWDEGLLLEVVDPTGVRVRFGYDPRGDLVSSTDAEGNTTRLVRDDAGRVSELVKPSGATTRFHYTPAGGQDRPGRGALGIPLQPRGSVDRDDGPCGCHNRTRVRLPWGVGGVGGPARASGGTRL
ncbi:hypothetical protein EII35_15650 [Arachnia propionica]|uniref:RHS repeat protein n=1 Tax=Arachnia propionica TaxID=1750 RepID=A0A3P1WHF0_9ACTN|nr:hypothetical protein EII35_15650 [Arachnia propionica]